MSILLDTNILVRCAEIAYPMCQLAADAIALLQQQNEQLCVVPQNIYEFWVVATRPIAVNGLGMSYVEAHAELSRLKQFFAVREEAPGVFASWEQLAGRYGVVGKNVHDARLVAAMLVNRIGRILTFNEQDFRRYQEITLASPVDVLAAQRWP